MNNNIPFGEINKFNVLIEIPEGTEIKFEYNSEYDAFVVDFIPTDLVWPFNYGEIFGTRGGDEDKLDVLVLSSKPLPMGSVVVCRAIGMAEIVDRGEEDNKIICVPVLDKQLNNLQDIGDLSEEQLRSYDDFFRELAVQKDKIMEIKGFRGKDRAEEEIKKSLKK